MVFTAAKILGLLAAVTLTILSSHAEASDACGHKPKPDHNCINGRTEYDFYTFAQSWQPEFCHDKDFDGCQSPEEFWKSSFTIHGLWSDLESKKFPCFCASEGLELEAIEEAVSYDTLTKYWPNVKATSESDYPGFWCSEWLKHGTCSGLEQPDYFKAAVDLAKKVETPSFIVENVGNKFSSDDVREAYGGKHKVILRCKDDKYLSEVHTCWSLGSDNMPVARVNCTSKSYEDNCQGTIEIVSFWTPTLGSPRLASSSESN